MHANVSSLLQSNVLLERRQMKRLLGENYHDSESIQREHCEDEQSYTRILTQDL